MWRLLNCFNTQQFLTMTRDIWWFVHLICCTLQTTSLPHRMNQWDCLDSVSESVKVFLFALQKVSILCEQSSCNSCIYVMNGRWAWEVCELCRFDCSCFQHLNNLFVMQNEPIASLCCFEETNIRYDQLLFQQRGPRTESQLILMVGFSYFNDYIRAQTCFIAAWNK